MLFKNKTHNVRRLTSVRSHLTKQAFTCEDLKKRCNVTVLEKRVLVRTTKENYLMLLKFAKAEKAISMAKLNVYV